ncbi:hypothetical protein HMPREF9946_02598 [Acetobacteraceae bacterium AT-5844]|nr:hypothetical protein HMPREF9946_02598 [Acetobacteraceae bacterium AT-5844]
MELIMQSSRADFFQLHIYREGMLTTAYRAADLVKAGVPAANISRELRIQAFRDDFGPDCPAVNDNQVQRA